jgi:hypothetical protein
MEAKGSSLLLAHVEVKLDYPIKLGNDKQGNDEEKGLQSSGDITLNLVFLQSVDIIKCCVPRTPWFLLQD